MERRGYFVAIRGGLGVQKCHVLTERVAHGGKEDGFSCCCLPFPSVTSSHSASLTSQTTRDLAKMALGSDGFIHGLFLHFSYLLVVRLYYVSLRIKT
jgi:hypothetical protein